MSCLVHRSLDRSAWLDSWGSNSSDENSIFHKIASWLPGTFASSRFFGKIFVTPLWARQKCFLTLRNFFLSQYFFSRNKKNNSCFKKKNIASRKKCQYIIRKNFLASEIISVEVIAPEIKFLSEQETKKVISVFFLITPWNEAVDLYG